MGIRTTWQASVYMLIVEIIVSTLEVSSHFSSKIAQEYQLPTASQVSKQLTFIVIMWRPDWAFTLAAKFKITLKFKTFAIDIFY